MNNSVIVSPSHNLSKRRDRLLQKHKNDGTPPHKKNGLLFYIKKDFFLYLMLLVPIAYTLIFRYGSMYGILIAFEDYNIFQGISKSPWNNFATFKEIFRLREFYTAVRNTLALNFLDLVAGFPAPCRIFSRGLSSAAS